MLLRSSANRNPTPANPTPVDPPPEHTSINPALIVAGVVFTIGCSVAGFALAPPTVKAVLVIVCTTLSSKFPPQGPGASTRTNPSKLLRAHDDIWWCTCCDLCGWCSCWRCRRECGCCGWCDEAEWQPRASHITSARLFR